MICNGKVILAKKLFLVETKHSQTHNYRAQIKQSSENQFIWPPFEAFDFLEEEKQLFPRPAEPVYIVYTQKISLLFNFKPFISDQRKFLI